VVIIITAAVCVTENRHWRTSAVKYKVLTRSFSNEIAAGLDEENKYAYSSDKQEDQLVH
jgi:hypothetical protein